MPYLYVFAGLSIALVFLQMIKKVSLSHPALVYPGIILFPCWCVYSAWDILRRMTNVLGSHTVIPSESLLDIFGIFSGALILNLLQALFLIGFPYLLFLVGYIKVNAFPYKRIAKCSPEQRKSAAQISCTRICWYALIMLAVYLPVAIFILIEMVEPILFGSSALAFYLPWGIAGALLATIVCPPLGILAFLVVAGLGAMVVISLLIPLLFAVLLLMVASILTLNAVIRTARFTGKKVLRLSLMSLFLGVNIGVLIYLLICLSRQKSDTLPIVNES